MTDTTVDLMVCCFYCGGNQQLQPTYIARKNEQFAKFIPNEPCGCCQRLFNSGVVIFETTTDHVNPGAPEAKPGVWCTGRWALVHPAQAVKLFSAECAPDLIQAGLAFVTTAAYKTLGLAERVEIYH